MTKYGGKMSHSSACINCDQMYTILWVWLPYMDKSTSTPHFHYPIGIYHSSAEAQDWGRGFGRYICHQFLSRLLVISRWPSIVGNIALLRCGWQWASGTVAMMSVLLRGMWTTEPATCRPRISIRYDVQGQLICTHRVTSMHNDRNTYLD